MKSSHWAEDIRRQSQICFLLSTRHPDSKLAWVEYKSEIFYSVVRDNLDLPVTAVTQLIQYLFDERIDHSFFILRNRIYTNQKQDLFSQNMVKITAKRATYEIGPIDSGLDLKAEYRLVSPEHFGIISSKHVVAFQKIENEKCDIKTAREVLDLQISLIPRGEVKHDYNRAIAAVLCDQSGLILDISTNQNYKNKTLHAEISLVQQFYQKTGRKIPRGSQIFVNLKPCPMCASAILYFAEDPESVKVYYLEDDPGFLNKETELDINHCISKIGS